MTSVLVIPKSQRWFYNKTLRTLSMSFIYLPLGLVSAWLGFKYLYFDRYDSTSPLLSYVGIPQAPIFLSHALKYGWDPLTNEPNCTDEQKSFLSCVLQQPPMWLKLRGPERWSELDVEKNSPCVWLWFLSSLILTVVIRCVSQAGIFSASLNVMIFIRTCPRLLDMSLTVSDITVLDTELCLHMTKGKRVGHQHCSLCVWGFFFLPSLQRMPLI